MGGPRKATTPPLCREPSGCGRLAESLLLFFTCCNTWALAHSQSPPNAWFGAPTMGFKPAFAACSGRALRRGGVQSPRWFRFVFARRHILRRKISCRSESPPPEGIILGRRVGERVLRVKDRSCVTLTFSRYHTHTILSSFYWGEFGFVVRGDCSGNRPAL